MIDGDGGSTCQTDAERPQTKKADMHDPSEPHGSSTKKTPMTGRRRTKICIVAASLDVLGGQGIQAQALAQHLRSEGYEICFVPINPRFPRFLQWLRRVPYVRTIVNELLYFPSLWRLWTADVVHVFSASYFSFLLGPAPALLAARLMGKRAILNYHSGEAEDHLARWGLLVHPWLRLAHEIVVPSQFLHKVFARFGFSAHVIENVIDTADFEFRKRSSLRPRLLSVRNLEPHYCVDVVIRAFALIRQQYPEATLLIAGYGTEERRLKSLTAELNLSGVTFYGRFSPSSAPKLYANADIFVNASVIDNQPVSILEAFASGVPVVTTSTGDIEAMLDGGALGMLVPPRNPQAIASAVEFLIEDPGQCADMSRRAYDSLARFSWEQVRHSWIEIYGSPFIGN